MSSATAPHLSAGPKLRRNAARLPGGVLVGSGVLDRVAEIVAEFGGEVALIAGPNGEVEQTVAAALEEVRRVTLTGRVVVDEDVIARAPVELNRAGLGSLLATYTAPADRRLAQLVGQEDASAPQAVAVARGRADRVLERADAIGRSEPAALQELCSALALGGVPGYEHTVCDLLEMAGARPLRGAAVGSLSVLAAMLWARVRTVARAGGLRALRFPTAAEMEPPVRTAFAQLDPSAGDVCRRAYTVKLERWNARRDELTTLWERWPEPEFDVLLASPERLVAALRAARAPVRLTHLGVRDATARWALAHAHLMGDRFTVADLAFFMGIWEDADVDALLVSAARLGAGL